MNLPNPPAGIYLEKHLVRHVVVLNNLHYDVSWHTVDNVHKYYLTICGQSNPLSPWRFSRRDIDPAGRTGKKILAALGKTPADFGY